MSTTPSGVHSTLPLHRSPCSRTGWSSSSNHPSAHRSITCSTTRHTAHDRVTGEAVDCCGSSVNEESTPQSGQAFKWPFLVEQRDYEFFDSTVREALPIAFEGVEEVDGHPGVEAYKFVQVVEPTVVETREIPRSLLGLDGEGDVTADIPGPVGVDQGHLASSSIATATARHRCRTFAHSARPAASASTGCGSASRRTNWVATQRFRGWGPQ